MKIWWNKLSYWKKGAFLGLVFWVLAILLFIMALILSELRIYVVGEFIGKISMYIIMFPIKILGIPIGVGNDIGNAFTLLFISIAISILSYPLLGALIGWFVNEIKKINS